MVCHASQCESFVSVGLLWAETFVGAGDAPHSREIGSPNSLRVETGSMTDFQVAELQKNAKMCVLLWEIIPSKHRIVGIFMAQQGPSWRSWAELGQSWAKYPNTARLRPQSISNR